MKERASCPAHPSARSNSLMDSQFLKFWGNYLLAAATGQKQLEDLNQWISQGFSGFEELTAMFKKYYGLERPRNETSDSTKMWQDAAAEFRNSFKAYLNLMGVVPQDKYRALEQKYAALKKKLLIRRTPSKF